MLTGEVIAALQHLRAAGLCVVLLTSRSAGWCDQIARLWPVDAVVGEHGAFYFCTQGAGKRMIRRDTDTPEMRASRRQRLIAIAEAILSAVPGAALAADQPHRESSLAIDIC